MTKAGLEAGMAVHHGQTSRERNYCLVQHVVQIARTKTVHDATTAPRGTRGRTVSKTCTPAVLLRVLVKHYLLFHSVMNGARLLHRGIQLAGGGRPAKRRKKDHGHNSTAAKQKRRAARQRQKETSSSSESDSDTSASSESSSEDTSESGSSSFSSQHTFTALLDR